MLGMKTSSMAFMATLALGSALALPALGQQAAGDFTTAQGLAQLCDADQAANRNLCHGILYGGLITARAFNGVELGNGDPMIARNDRIVCPPGQGISLADMRRNYLQWYENEPTARSMSATSALVNFMADEWSCDNAGQNAARDNDRFGRPIYLNNEGGPGGAKPADLFEELFRGLDAR